MEIELLGNVTPIHMLGESHVLAYSNLVFRSTWTNETFICRTKFLPMIPASDYGSDSHLNPGLSDALVAEGILDRYLRPFFLTVDDSAACYSGSPIIAPPIVIFAGDTDLQALFMRIGNQFDFELPDDTVHGVDRSKQPIAFSEIQREVTRIVSPVIGVARQLRSIGFSRLMIHCLPPRYLDTARASLWSRGIEVGAPVRAKLALLANRILRDACGSYDIGFIDTWPELEENGYLKSEFELDGIHLNRKGAILSLNRISNFLIDQTRSVHNISRYNNLIEESAPYEGDLALKAAWQAHGIVTGQIGTTATAAILAGLRFEDLGQENMHARSDWSGFPRVGRTGVILAKPNDSVLELASSVLSLSPASDLLHAGSERAFSIINFRPIIYECQTTSLSDNMATPPNCRRAIIILKSNNRICFETLDGNRFHFPQFESELCEGTLIVFDPGRLRFRVNKGDERLIIVEIGALPRFEGQPFRIIWAGLCEWPADPFQYSVSGMLAYPPLNSARVSQRMRMRFQHIG
jgi:hypothetical protein